MNLEDFDPEVLKADLMKYAETYCKAVAKEGVERIPKQVNKVLDEYYGEYPSPSPYGYFRTNNFHDNPMTEWYNEGAYEGGAIVTSGTMGGYPKAGIPLDAIFNLDWNYGSHGVRGGGGFSEDIENEVVKTKSEKRKVGIERAKELNRMALIVVSDSPQHKMENFLRDPTFNKEVDSAAENAAKSESYTYLSF